MYLSGVGGRSLKMCVCVGGGGGGGVVGVGREWEETQRSLTGGLIEQAQMSVMGGGGYMSMPKEWVTEGAKLQ